MQERKFYDEKNYSLFLKALSLLKQSRDTFLECVEKGIILGNDNHIGDIGEYWVARYFESLGETVHLGKVKNDLVDLSTDSGKKDFC
jgi:hypothetical protein